MIAILVWLTGSRTGQIAAVALLGVAAAAWAIWRIFHAGAASADARHAARETAEKIEILTQKVRTDEELRRLDPAARRQRLRQWAAGRG